MKLMITALMMSSTLAFGATVGKPAPDFSLPSSAGKSVKLSEHKGKIVVLEWLNHGCPFVRKHYDSKNMQDLQKKYTGKGVVWLSVISSAPGKQGHSTAVSAEAEKKKNNSAATAILIDEKGEVGKLYGAKTTPHMYVIDSKGSLVYMGAIDDNSSADPADVKTAKNYVTAALESTLAGKKVETTQTESYGCSVKY